jgi:hypothetical protein
MELEDVVQAVAKAVLCCPEGCPNPSHCANRDTPSDVDFIRFVLATAQPMLKSSTLEEATTATDARHET